MRIYPDSSLWFIPKFQYNKVKALFEPVGLKKDLFVYFLFLLR